MLCEYEVSQEEGAGDGSVQWAPSWGVGIIQTSGCKEIFSGASLLVCNGSWDTSDTSFSHLSGA